jgi:hypothetical protein
MSVSDQLNNVALDEDSSAPLSQILARAKEFARNHAKKYGGDGQLGLLVIDNLQIAEMGEESDKNTVNAINKFCKDCKGIAKELNIPVVTLSQMNRASLSGNDKRPTAQGLFGATGIQANADAVLGIYRDEYYHKDTVDRGIAEILPLKVRDSAPDTVARLEFRGHYASFVDNSRPKLVSSEPKQAIAQESDESYYNGLKVGDSVVVNETYSLFRNQTTIADMIANKEIPPFGVICTVTRLWTEEYLGSKMGGAALKTSEGIELHSSPDYLRLT